MSVDAGYAGPAALSVPERVRGINWLFVLLLCTLAGIGVAVLYSVAGGDMEPWARTHAQRFAIALLGFFIAAMVDIRVWMRIAIPAYIAVLALLIAVEVAGAMGGGARRWLSLAAVQIQPSEFMKLTLVLALARYYQRIDSRTVSWPSRLIIPLALIAVPAALVLRQPDLGTTVLLFAGGATVMLAAGVHWLYFGAALALAGAAAPFAWATLHAYQKARVLTFLDPERDPLGAGYHIIQSKIALGSGGAFGKGFVQGTQSQLDFIPEKHTDFIFTIIGEEFGLVGAVTVIALFGAVVLAGLVMATGVKNRFGRLASLGIASTLFYYVFVNIAMVAGLLPVVGVPLPLISYGGTVMAMVMVGFGVLMSAHIDRERMMPRPLSRQW